MLMSFVVLIFIHKSDLATLSVRDSIGNLLLLFCLFRRQFIGQLNSID